MGNIPVRRCTVDGCEGAYYAKGLCGKHYARVRTNGSLELKNRTKAVCGVQGCKGKHEANGLCGKHYQRMKKSGSTSDPVKPDDSIERFWSRVDRIGECWLWIGHKNAAGYGVLSVRGKPVLAHRLSYFLHFGKGPGDLLVCHTCDIRACVNPQHLFLGTHLDNHNDMRSKGRDMPLRGERNGRSKLTETQVREIKALYQNGTTQRALAKRFGVAHGTISRITIGVAWKHL